MRIDFRLLGDRDEVSYDLDLSRRDCWITGLALQGLFQVDPGPKRLPRRGVRRLIVGHHDGIYIVACG